MNYKEHLIACGKRMLHSGLTVETWGNISVRDPETGLIYPVSYTHLTLPTILLV